MSHECTVSLCFPPLVYDDHPSQLHCPDIWGEEKKKLAGGLILRVTMHEEFY